MRYAVVYAMFCLLVLPRPALALDSYRYLHVSIETPWAIFLFLLPIVLSPFILMIILYWRQAIRKAREEEKLQQ